MIFVLGPTRTATFMSRLRQPYKSNLMNEMSRYTLDAPPVACTENQLTLFEEKPTFP